MEETELYNLNNREKTDRRKKENQTNRASQTCETAKKDRTLNNWSPKERGESGLG